MDNMNDLITKNSEYKNDNMGVLLVAFMMFLPMSSICNILRLGIAVLLFIMVSLRKGINNITKTMFIIFACMLMSLIFSRLAVLAFEGKANEALWIHELQRIGFYIILILVVYNYKVSFDFLFKICVVTLFFHVTIQTLQLMGVEAVFDFIETYYLEEGDSGIHLSLARSKNIASFRSGSIYMNPNVYMVVPLSILGVVLQRDKQKFSLFNMFLIMVTLYSLLLTGSRTSVIIAICMIVYYIIKREELHEFRWVFLGFGAVILIATIGILAAKYRAFNIVDGLSSSLGVKMENFSEYIIYSPTVYLITGSLSSRRTVGMDSEWTHIYAYFGILGIIWYVSFLKLLLRNKEKYPIHAKLLTLNVCMVAASASVMLCMPVFSFVCLLLLAEIE